MSPTNSVSRDDASKEVMMPTSTVVAHPGTRPGFHPETSCSKVATPNGTLNRESDARCAAAIPS
jgi:hypothetical protein